MSISPRNLAIKALPFEWVPKKTLSQCFLFLIYFSVALIPFFRLSGCKNDINIVVCPLPELKNLFRNH